MTLYYQIWYYRKVVIDGEPKVEVSFGDAKWTGDRYEALLPEGSIPFATTSEEIG